MSQPTFSEEIVPFTRDLRACMANVEALEADLIAARQVMRAEQESLARFHRGELVYAHILHPNKRERDWYLARVHKVICHEALDGNHLMISYMVQRQVKDERFAKREQFAVGDTIRSVTEHEAKRESETATS